MSGRSIATALLFGMASIPLSHAGNQTWTRPADTYLLELPASVGKVTFTLIGAGGGGGHGAVAPDFLFFKGGAAAGGGGGGGATLICTLVVMPGSALLVTVGAGGVASAGGGASGIRIREPGGAISAFTFFAYGGEGGGHGRSRLLSRSPGHAGRGGKGSTTPDCVLVEGFAGRDATAVTPGKGAPANPEEAAKRVAILRGLKAQRSEQATASAADAARAALCKGAGTGGDGGVASSSDGRPGSDGCVSVDY